MDELTASEVAALFDVDERRIRKDVEYGVFGRMKSPPRFDLGAVVYFLIVSGIELDLAVEDRKKLYRAIVAAIRSKSAHDLEVSAYVVVKLGSAARDADKRLREFARWKAKLVERDDILGGETVFPKTRLAVRHIGELARRGGTNEIVVDYRSLSEQDVDFAARFVAAYPRIGRPRAHTGAR
jgi:uncharacterized protein (DUF433 family)